jgi:hypothetical protein
MQLTGTVNKPAHELPTRKVTGLACTRDSQSGKRFWGLFEKLCGPPEAFFRDSFVYSLCPLGFFSGSGRSVHNITPPEIKVRCPSLIFCSLQPDKTSSISIPYRVTQNSVCRQFVRRTLLLSSNCCNQK